MSQPQQAEVRRPVKVEVTLAPQPCTRTRELTIKNIEGKANERENDNN